jgi:CheY-like chemotaxis protein
MKPVQPRAASEKRKIVLYVEDEDDNWDVAVLRLGWKYDLRRARNALEFCKVLHEVGSELHAILMDVQLSGSELDGIELTRLLRGTLPAARRPPYAVGLPVLPTVVIFVTAYGTRYPESQLVAAGGNQLITKPVDFVDLNLALASVQLGSARQLLRMR